MMRKKRLEVGSCSARFLWALLRWLGARKHQNSSEADVELAEVSWSVSGHVGNVLDVLHGRQAFFRKV